MSLASSNLRFASAGVQAQSCGRAQIRLGHRPWLDGLRGLAILSVMAYHGGLLARGHAGVDLFFVVSGFLITLLLLEEQSNTGAISFKRFYARRALRLFPALAVMLCVSLLLMFLAPGVGQHYRSVLYSAFYVTNWIVAFDLDRVSSTLYITWSLAIEEQFYFVWPITLAVLLRFARCRRIVVGGLVALLILVCLWRVFLVSQGVAEVRIGQGSDTRSDGLVVGCLLAAVVSFGWLPSVRVVRFAVAVLALCFAAYLLEIVGNFGVGLTLINLFFASLILLLLLESSPLFRAVLENPFVIWIGKLSYSLYLWHLLARFAAETFIGGPGARIAVSVILAFAMAALSYYVIERPFLMLKRRFNCVAGRTGEDRGSMGFAGKCRCHWN